MSLPTVAISSCLLQTFPQVYFTAPQIKKPAYNFTPNKKFFILMREKILAQLIAKYAGVSKTALGLIADKLAKKVTEDSGIDQAITDFDNAIPFTEFAADLQREPDRRVGEAKKEWEKKNPKPGPPKPEDNPDPAPPDDMPWLKTLTNQLKTLGEQVSTLAKEKTQGTIKSKATELLKEVPGSFWNGREIPDREDDLQGFVDNVTNDFNAFKQEQIDKGFMTATPPGGGGADGGAANGKMTTAAEKAIDADIASWASKNKPVTADSTTKK